MLRFAGADVHSAVELYRRTNKTPLFAPRTGPPPGAPNPPIQNVGKMRNRGYDLAISYSGTIGTDKVWSVAFNGSHYNNVILSIDGQLTKFIDGAIGPQITRVGNPAINMVGQPTGAFFANVPT